jgi:predicted house-cleaning noncanonical NTP pyrophosphatase (MazG superfamily)
MSRVYYNKLIRDLIPTKIRNNQEECSVRRLDDDTEYEQELLKKVTEEAKGVAMARSRSEFLSEYADLMVVLDALTQQYGFSEADIRVAMAENVEKKGLYKERYFLHWSSDTNYQSNETPQGTKS